MAIDFSKMFEARDRAREDRPPVVRIINAPPRYRDFYAARQSEPKVVGECSACETEPKAEARLPHEREVLPLTREVLHVNALRRVPGPLIDVPMIAPRHKRKRWMTDSYHRRIQKKWDKQAKGKTMKVPRTEPVILSLSKIAVDKIIRAARLSRAAKVRATTEDLTIPHEGKFPPLRVVVNHDDHSVDFKTREQEITATAEDFNSAEWVTLTLRPGGRHA